MRTKRLLVTLGASFAFGSALISCGFAQPGDKDYEEKYQEIDLSAYKDSYWQEGQTDAISDTIHEVIIGKESSATADAAKVQYDLKDADGNSINIDSVKGLKGIDYTYFKRASYLKDTTADNYQKFYEGDRKTGNLKYLKDEAVAVPTEAGEYFVVASFRVDEDRYKPVDPWVATVNVYHESPYSAEDLTFISKELTQNGEVHGYQVSASIAGKNMPVANDLAFHNVDGLTGIGKYKYSISSSGRDYLASEVTDAGTYGVRITLEAKDYYQLPILQPYEARGEAKATLTIKPGSTGLHSVTYVSAQGTAPSTVSNVAAISASMLPSLSVAGYVFGGWYTDAAFTTKAGVGDTLTDDVTLYAKWTETEWHKFVSANTGNIVIADDFSDTTKTYAQVDSENWRTETAGIYFREQFKEEPGANVHNNRLEVTSDGKLDLINDNKYYGTQACLNFGTTYTSGTVTGIIDIEKKSGSGTNAITAIQFFGKKTTNTNANSADRYSNTSEFFGIRCKGSQSVWMYRLDGGTEVAGTSSPSAAVGAVTTFEFTLDIDAQTLTVKANGSTFVTLTDFDVTEFSAIRIASGDGNVDTFLVDNVAIAHVEKEVDIDAYKTTKKNAVDAVYTNLNTEDYENANLLTVIGLVTDAKAAIDAASTVADIDAAFNTFTTSLEAVPKKEKSTFTVTYSTAHGTAPASVETAELTAAQLPTLTAEGYVFKGWFLDSALTNEAVEGQVIVMTTTIYAKWEETAYTTIANGSSKLYANNFATDSVIGEFAGAATDYVSAAGLSQRLNEKTAGTDEDKALNGAVIENGVLKLKNGSSKYGTQVVYDFGRAMNSGKITIAMDLVIDSAFTATQQPIQFYGTSSCETPGATNPTPFATTIGDIFGIRSVLKDGSNSFQYRLNGDKDHGVSSLTGTGFTTGTYTFVFVFDFDTQTLTVTLNGKAFASIAGVTSLAQMRIATGDGNTNEFAVDNLAIAHEGKVTYTTAATSADVAGLDAGLYAQVTTSAGVADEITEGNSVKNVGDIISINDTNGNTTIAYYVLDESEVINTGKVEYSMDIDITGYGSKWNFISMYDSTGADVLALRTCGISGDTVTAAGTSKYMGYSLDGGIAAEYNLTGVSAEIAGNSSYSVKIVIDYDNNTCDITVTKDGAAYGTAAITDFTATDVKVIRFMTGASASDRSYTVTMPVVKAITE